MDLLKSNVSSAQVSPVIRAVAKLCSRSIPDVESLPSRSAVDTMRVRGLAISHQQMQELRQEADMTLYTDETRKRGVTYMTYAFTTKEKETRVLGVQEMATKSAEDTLTTLVDLIKKVSQVSGEPDLGEKIIVNLKNTMSDGASTEHLFNTLLEDYRATLVPKLVAGFEEFSVEQQAEVKQMNNFFCGLHLMIAFADTFSSIVKIEEGNRAVGAETAT